MTTIDEKYEDLNERNKTRIRKEFCEKFGKTPDAFYKNIKGRTIKIKEDYLKFFAEQFNCTVEDLTKYKVAEVATRSRRRFNYYRLGKKA